MVAIPRAYLTLGAALGTAMLALVALLVLHSKALLVDGARRYRGATTYRRLVQSAVGPRTGLLAQVSVILFCFGFVVVNLVVLTDVVRGNPPAACNGLVCLLTGAVNGPLESRSLVLLAVAGGAAAPLLLLRCRVSGVQVMCRVAACGRS
jgi:amino acid permease